jgi:hypothetical protein
MLLGRSPWPPGSRFAILIERLVWTRPFNNFDVIGTLSVDGFTELADLASERVDLRSSHFNFVADFGLGVLRRVGTSSWISVGVDLHHVSNAGAVTPTVASTSSS